MRKLGPQLAMAEVEFHYHGIYQSLGEIKTAEEELQQRRANPWGSAEQRAVRENLIKVAGVYAALTKAKMQIFERVNDKPVSYELAVAPFQRGDIDEESLKFTIKAYYQLRKVIEAEMTKIYVLMDKHFEGVTLHT